jgi:hypothetical protein
MSFTIVSWEVSTGDAARAARITLAAERALGPFGPARLLVGCFLLDSETQNVEIIRRALDRVAAGFPQEFFYTAAKQAEADVQGVYPPFADMNGAHAITGSPRNPLPRTVPVSRSVVAASRVGRGAPRGVPAAAAVGRTRGRGRKPSRRAGGKAARGRGGRTPTGARRGGDR